MHRSFSKRDSSDIHDTVEKGKNLFLFNDKCIKLKRDKNFIDMKKFYDEDEDDISLENMKLHLPKTVNRSFFSEKQHYSDVDVNALADILDYPRDQSMPYSTDTFVNTHSTHGNCDLIAFPTETPVNSTSNTIKVMIPLYRIAIEHRETYWGFSNLQKKIPQNFVWPIVNVFTGMSISISPCPMVKAYIPVVCRYNKKDEKHDIRLQPLFTEVHSDSDQDVFRYDCQDIFVQIHRDNSYVPLLHIEFNKDDVLTSGGFPRISVTSRVLRYTTTQHHQQPLNTCWYRT